MIGPSKICCVKDFRFPIKKNPHKIITYWKALPTPKHSIRRQTSVPNKHRVAKQETLHVKSEKPFYVPKMTPRSRVTLRNISFLKTLSNYRPKIKIKNRVISTIRLENDTPSEEEFVCQPKYL